MSKFCKICQDSGKPSSVFRSHNVRNRGNVVCPILLATECRFCKMKGHTPKFCPKLKERELRLGIPPRNKIVRTSRHGQRRIINVPIVASKRVEKVNVEGNKDVETNINLFIIQPSQIPWGDGHGEDEPFQRELVERIRKYGKY